MMKKYFFGMFILPLLLSLSVCAVAQTQTLALGEKLLDQSIAGKNLLVTIALQQTLINGGMNTVGTQTNRSFVSFVEFSDFIIQSSLRLKSFLPLNQGAVRYRVRTDFANTIDKSLIVDTNLGPVEGLTGESFRVHPIQSVTAKLYGVVGAKFKRTESEEYHILSVLENGVVFDNTFFTNSGRLRIVLTMSTGEDAVYTQYGNKLEPPTVNIFKEQREHWFDYDFYVAHEYGYEPRRYSFIMVNGSFGADTVLETSQDFISWEQIGKISWDQYPVLMIEVDYWDQAKFFRAWSY